MSVKNSTRGTILAKTLLTMNTHFNRTLYHLNVNGFPRNCALWITPCHSVSTVGMKNPVDIVFLDKDGRVVKMFRNFPPNCIAESEPEAVSAIELPSNRLHESKTSTGDILTLEPA
jgi:hypothetical protein